LFNPETPCRPQPRSPADAEDKHRPFVGVCISTIRDPRDRRSPMGAAATAANRHGCLEGKTWKHLVSGRWPGQCTHWPAAVRIASTLPLVCCLVHAWMRARSETDRNETHGRATGIVICMLVACTRCSLCRSTCAWSVVEFVYEWMLLLP
jgi:hypothetical protein